MTGLVRNALECIKLSQKYPTRTVRLYVAKENQEPPMWLMRFDIGPVTEVEGIALRLVGTWRNGAGGFDYGET